MLVNSVDERQSLSGGLSGAIASGCGINQSQAIPLNIGDVAIHRCGGVYAQKYGIDWVANVAVMVWENPNSSKLPCYNSYGTDPNSGYQTCISDAVKKGLGKLFGELHRRQDIRLDSVVFPALGTGTGQLSKELFYRNLFSQLTKELDYKGPSRLPESVLLQVYPEDPPDIWGQTKTSIASETEDLIDNWVGSNKEADWPSLVGILAGLIAVLAYVGAGYSLPIVAEDIAEQFRVSSVTLAMGWFSAAFGLEPVDNFGFVNLPTV